VQFNVFHGLTRVSRGEREESGVEDGDRARLESYEGRDCFTKHTPVLESSKSKFIRNRESREGVNSSRTSSRRCKIVVDPCT